MYHYVECGLDNVFLRNGYRLVSAGGYGEVALIESAEELHRAIAMRLARQSRALTGQEFRFLRGELRMTQEELGRRLGHADRQSVARWEKAIHKPVPQLEDAVIRVLYLEDRGMSATMHKVTAALAKIQRDGVKARQLRFGEAEDGSWVPALAKGERELTFA